MTMTSNPIYRTLAPRAVRRPSWSAARRWLLAFLSVLSLFGVMGLQPAAAQIAITGATKIEVGDSHTCALTSAGGVKCWGINNVGQLGDGSTTDRLTAVDVSGLTSGVTDIAVGADHTCAVTSAGGVKCWGWNAYGQLGDGSTTLRLTAVDVSGLSSGVTAIAAGTSHTCAVTSAGGVKCWGRNVYGQLGDGSTTNSLTAVDVSGLTSVVTAIAAGNVHTCALTSAGGAKCWGRNSNGQLGDGSTTDSLTAVDVSGLISGVAAIAAGYTHTCAVTSTGGAKCWGSNYYAQLGDNRLMGQVTAVDVVGLTSGVTAIATGAYHTCAVTSTGGAKCWAWNNYGQLGDGSTRQRTIAVNVSGLTSGATAITASPDYTCALTSTGGVKCWGRNFNGQLGDGTTTDSNTPVVALQAPTAPATPAAPTATAGNATASVSFVAPADNGSPITGYTVVSTPAGGVDSNAGSTSLTHNITGLTNGTAYTFTVTATNGVGTSSASAVSNSAIPATAPGTPAAPIATAGNRTASVSFAAPANNGSPISSYTVVSIPAGGVDSNAGTTGLTHNITGLTNGTAYTFTVTATNGAGTSSASPASNSVTPAAPVVPDPIPAIPLLPVTIPGIGAGSLPSILNMGMGDGPSFMGQLVGLLSREVGSALRFVEQNATGTVSLGGYNGGNLAFLPHSFQVGDFRANGVYPTGNGQYQVVVNGQSLFIAPSMVRLDQMSALLPGIAASMADTGVITATLNATTFVMQPGVAVQLNPPTGQSSLVLGDDGMYRFTDALGNTQILYPAFAAPAILRSVLQSIDPAATVSIALDATASAVIGGVRYTLVPDLTLGGVSTEQLGKRYWPDGPNRYRMWVSIGQSQGLTVLRP